jgi:hypothetical protein
MGWEHNGLAHILRSDDDTWARCVRQGEAEWSAEDGEALRLIEVKRSPGLNDVGMVSPPAGSRSDIILGDDCSMVS